jgi:hypothetical protein
MAKILLSLMEVRLATDVGVVRHVEALRRARPDAYGRSDEDGWTAHIEGACGELACAKALGIYWLPTVNTFKTGGDVASFQVRTRSRDDYQLYVRPDDSDDAIFILVRGIAPRYEVVGWMRGRDAKRPEWFKTFDRRPKAYFVPDAFLHHDLDRLKGA